MNIENLFSTGQPISEANGVLLFVIVVWSLIWKGLSLWRAARRGDTAWYVAMLILNTVGILEIIYYFFFSKKEKKTK